MDGDSRVHLSISEWTVMHTDNNSENKANTPSSSAPVTTTGGGSGSAPPNNTPTSTNTAEKSSSGNKEQPNSAQNQSLDKDEVAFVIDALFREKRKNATNNTTNPPTNDDDRNNNNNIVGRERDQEITPAHRPEFNNSVSSPAVTMSMNALMNASTSVSAAQQNSVCRVPYCNANATEAFGYCMNHSMQANSSPAAGYNPHQRINDFQNLLQNAQHSAANNHPYQAGGHHHHYLQQVQLPYNTSNNNNTHPQYQQQQQHYGQVVHNNSIAHEAAEALTSSFRNNVSTSNSTSLPKRSRTSTPRDSKVCRLATCHEPAEAYGYCGPHSAVKNCKVPGCGKRAQTGGKCFRHGGGKPCGVENCPKRAVKRGFCTMHRVKEYCMEFDEMTQRRCQRLARRRNRCQYHMNLIKEQDKKSNDRIRL